jgi:hypothetical protein
VLIILLGYTIHARGRVEGICGIIVSDNEYPDTVAHSILSKICDEFTVKYPRTAYANATRQAPNSFALPELKEYIVKYQDPDQANSISKIQKELDETKNILHKTIESVLERGEKIDNLVAKSDGLSAQSKMFYTQVSNFRISSRVGNSVNSMCRRKNRTPAAWSCEYALLAFSFPLGILSPGTYLRREALSRTLFQ